MAPEESCNKTDVVDYTSRITEENLLITHAAKCPLGVSLPVKSRLGVGFNNTHAPVSAALPPRLIPFCREKHCAGAGSPLH